MRRALLSAPLALAALLAAPPHAQADPWSDAFDALRTELEERRGGFVAPLDRTEAQQKAAVTKALALLGKRSTSLTTDLRTAVAILPALERAYPVELGPTPVASDLRIAVGATTARLRTLTEQRRGAMGVTILVLRPSPTRDKLQSALGAASEQIAAAAAEPQGSRAAKLLQSADRALGKVASGVARLGNEFGAFVVGEEFDPPKVTAVYEEATGRLTITGTSARRGDYRRLAVDGIVAAQGPNTMTGTWTQGTSAAAATVSTAEDAVVNVMSLDVAGRRAAGTFAFLALDAQDTPTDVGAGSFVVKLVVK